MPRYLELAEDLRKEVNTLVATNPGLDPVALGHIINLAVRCSPHGIQHTVRKNIVETAMRDHCRVTMTELPKTRFPDDDGSYWKINIEKR